MKYKAMFFHTSAPTRSQVLVTLEGGQIEEMIKVSLKSHLQAPLGTSL